MKSSIPIITIDGLSGSGKTTISTLLSARLNWNLLDSGILYRSLSYLIKHESIDIKFPNKISELLAKFKLETNNNSNVFKAIYNNKDISSHLYGEDIGKSASEISKIKFVRDLLLPLQHSCLRAPGLIANGRDMGTKVFPNATLKVFFTADVEIRAKRRYQELLEKGQKVDFDTTLNLLKTRDETDQNRKISPLEPAHDAKIIDSTHLNIESVLDKIFELYTISGV